MMPSGRSRAALLGLVVALPFTPLLLGRVIWSSDIAKVYHPAAAVLSQALHTRSIDRILWNPDVAAGFPLVADGAFGALNPLTWLLASVAEPARIPALTLLVAYLFAAFSLRSFVRALGCSEAAALVASIAYAFSGFAVSHLVHPNIVLGLGFLPLLSLVVHRSSERGPWRTAALLGLLWGLACLTSHPQMAFLALLSAALYALASGGSQPRALFQKGLVLVGASLLGLTIAAPFYLPMRELAQESVRTAGRLPYEQAVQYALSPLQLLTALSPHLFFDGPGSRGAYCGPWNAEEMGFYFGIVPLVLALLALGSPRSMPVRFFASLSLGGLLLGLGASTPAYRIIHALPIVGGFRGPARWTVLTTFAVAVLAALAFDRLRRGATPTRFAIPLQRTLLVIAGLTLALPFVGPALRGAQVPPPGSLETLGSLLLVGRDFGPPVLLLAAAFLFRHSLLPRRGRESLGPMLLVFLTILDLGTTAIRSLEAHVTRPATLEQESEAISEARDQPERVYTVDDGEPWRAASDAHLVHGVNAFGGYFSLPLHRFVQYQKAFWLSDQTAGTLLDRAAVSTVVDTWARPLAPVAHLAGITFSPRRPLAVVDRLSPTAEFLVDRRSARTIALVSALQEARSTPQGATVATLVFRSAQRPEQRVPIRAGVETAQRVCDEPCSHLRPPTHLLAWSRVDERSDGAFFLARLPLDPTWLGGSLRIENAQVKGKLLVFGIVLEDEPTGSSRAVTPFMSIRYSPSSSGRGGRVFSNRTVAPLARIAYRTVEANGLDEALHLAASLPADTVVLEADDRSPGTPRQRASQPPDDDSASFASHPAEAPAAPVQSADTNLPTSVRFLRDDALEVRLEATLATEGYLVLADTFYPGWTAAVDGVAVPVRRADVLFRAVRVPEGRHEVVFRYSAAPFHRGLLLCLVGLLVGCAVLVIPWTRASAVRCAVHARASGGLR